MSSEECEDGQQVKPAKAGTLAAPGHPPWEEELWLAHSGAALLLATALLRSSRAAFALEKKKRNEEKIGNRKPCEKSSDQVQRVMDCCNRHCIGEDRDQPGSVHSKNESARPG